jgi:hypothetical protein
MSKIPSAREMEQSRKTLYFRDDTDTRIVVTVTLLPNGEWGAFLDDDNDYEGRPLGQGDTMMAAIVDLREQMAEEG